jgi:membrane dipeptidase
MLIIDGDYPMAFGALELNRDLTLPVRDIRRAIPDRYAQDAYPDSETMASLPELRRAKVAAALVKVVGRIQRPGGPLWGYRGAEAAYANAQAALAYYRILEARGHARILTTRPQLVDHMRTWSEATDHSNLPLGFILGMEGADPILWPEHVHDWWADGLRVVSLSHYGVSTYCHGTGTGVSGGLFPPATALLKEMGAVGMILDLTYAAIGGDTDGQGGRAGAPLEIDTVSDYQKVATVLERRGYSQEDIANVMHRNWQRFFETHLPT